MAANSTANSRTCRPRRAGANGWAASRRRCSPPPGRSCAKNLARVVGANCNIDLILDDIRDELRGRPYEIVAVAGGWSFRTRLGFGEAIRAALGGPTKSELSKPNAVVLMAIAYFQPITRGELSQLLGREVSRDAIAALRERRPDRRRTAQPDPRRALRLCHDAGVFGGIRVRKPARPAGHRKAGRTPGCSAEPAQRISPGMISRPSCEGCWVWRPTRASRTKTPRKTILSRKKKQAVPRCAHRDFGVDLSG